ncbi:hypothetical protein EZS27_017432 [termite gut metagenome]|jgi:hypothetical protein|uniref:WbqC-like protein family protein n=1 Tax=termite gut metagenome TaxID=433724 RepID=A0A5J4RJ88_9ZZZZ
MSFATVYLSSFYLAPVEYYTKLLKYDKVCMEQYDHYTKQTYRNRCVIAATERKSSVLSIPIIHFDNPKCLMKDIRISNHGNWRHIHWNAIVAAYGNTPFFDYYRDDFYSFYENRYTFLIDFNEELCRLVCQLIDISFVGERTTKYKTDLAPDEYDFRETIHPKRSFRTENSGFIPFPYYQVFECRHGFIPNLSIIDLLFNMGQESLLILLKSMDSK